MIEYCGVVGFYLFLFAQVVAMVTEFSRVLACFVRRATVVLSRWKCKDMIMLHVCSEGVCVNFADERRAQLPQSWGERKFLLWHRLPALFSSNHITVGIACKH